MLERIKEMQSLSEDLRTASDVVKIKLVNIIGKPKSSIPLVMYISFKS